MRWQIAPSNKADEISTTQRLCPRFSYHDAVSPCFFQPCLANVKSVRPTNARRDLTECLECWDESMPKPHSCKATACELNPETCANVGELGAWSRNGGLHDLTSGMDVGPGLHLWKRYLMMSILVIVVPVGRARCVLLRTAKMVSSSTFGGLEHLRDADLMACCLAWYLCLDTQEVGRVAQHWGHLRQTGTYRPVSRSHKLERSADCIAREVPIIPRSRSAVVRASALS